MQEKVYFVVDGPYRLGPFDDKQILDMVFSNQITLEDIVLNVKTQETKRIAECEFYQLEVTQLTTLKNLNTGQTTTPGKISFQDLRNEYHSKRENRIRSAFGPSENANTSAPKSTSELSRNSIVCDYFIKIQDQVLGPVRFLMIITLVKNKKITLDTPLRSEFDKNWKTVRSYLPAELISTVQGATFQSEYVLKKSLWKRKNVRIEYDELVIVKNQEACYVGRSIDLSSEGLAVVGPKKLEVNDSAELNLFDLQKNITSIKAKLVRQDPIPQSGNDTMLYKSVFIFNQKIKMKNFVD